MLVLGGCACAGRVEPLPSQAIEEVLARAANRGRAEAVACKRLTAEAPAELELPFGYADNGLTEAAQLRLDEALQWLRCVSDGRVVLAVETEHHYKNPDLEARLRNARADAIAGRLTESGIASARILVTPGTASDGASVLVLRLRGRGW